MIKGVDTLEPQHTTTVSQINRQHRDTLFRGIFKEPQHFLQLLKHCNSGDTNLTPEDIQPFDLTSDVAIRIRRNDVSFITTDNRLIILIEHQSTQCPNMALRLFIYYIELLQLWIKNNNVNLYGQQKIIDLPLPEFYVAYNGVKKLTDIYSTFALSHVAVKIDIKVKIVDIHYENLENIDTNNVLAGYSFFYKIYDGHIRSGLSSQESFITAREACITHGYLKGFIDKEDFVMHYKDILDYDTQLKEEGKAEGKVEGRAEGKVEGKVEGRAEGKELGFLEAAMKFIEKGFSLQDVAEILTLSESQIGQLKKAIV